MLYKILCNCLLSWKFKRS